MKQGRDYVIFPLDVPSGGTARHLVSKLHNHVGIFKIGLELFIHTGPDLIRWITEHTGAGVFLDLKLHDIPATVERAMRGISDLNVELATVHCGESRSMLEAAVAGSSGKVNILGVTVLTSVVPSDLRSAGYADQMIEDLSHLVLHKASMAKEAGCAGVVCSGLEVKLIKEKIGSDFMTVTPGIRPEWAVDNKDDQKRVVTPAMAVSAGSDYVVIGRPIRNATDQAAAAARIAEEIDAVL